MNLYCVKCSKVTNNNNIIKIKRETNGKIYLYSHCIEFAFKKSKTIIEEEVSA